MSGEVRTMLDVSGTEAFRQERFDFLAEQFRAMVAEEGCHLSVNKDDVAVCVHRESGIWCGLQEAVEYGFVEMLAGLSLGYGRAEKLEGLFERVLI
jgi:hypothetical protein